MGQVKKAAEPERDIVEGDDPSLEALLTRIGGRIRELRELQGISLRALEEFTGIVTNELRTIEAGRRNITVRTADKIARAIGVRTEELFVPRERSAIRPKRKKRGA